MFGSDSPRPTPPALPDPLPAAPTYASGSASKPAGSGTKVPGFGSTLLTSGQGVDDSGTNYSRKSLLGQ